jgi:mannose-6-phosphate isomerase-like protein (cupin superfamily)
MKRRKDWVLGMIAFVLEDERRELSEFDTEYADFSVQRFVVKERIPLGNHYHTKKDEVFVILSGRGRVILQKVGVNKNGETTLPLKKGSVVYIPKNTAHTFLLEIGSEMICFSTKAFDKDDMHEWKLL